jgi:hypothetical protein
VRRETGKRRNHGLLDWTPQRTRITLFDANGVGRHCGPAPRLPVPFAALRRACADQRQRQRMLQFGLQKLELVFAEQVVVVARLVAMPACVRKEAKAIFISCSR